MLRVLNLFLPLCFFFSSVVWTYNAKYATMELAEELRRLQHQITQEEELIAILDSEWQFINSPARLQAQKEATFPEMIPLTALQVSEGNDIPFRLSEPMGVEAGGVIAEAKPTSVSLEALFSRVSRSE